jgi:hypothetical protein
MDRNYSRNFGKEAGETEEAEETEDFLQMPF